MEEGSSSFCRKMRASVARVCMVMARPGSGIGPSQSSLSRLSRTESCLEDIVAAVETGNATGLVEFNFGGMGKRALLRKEAFLFFWAHQVSRSRYVHKAQTIRAAERSSFRVLGYFYH